MGGGGSVKLEPHTRLFYINFAQAAGIPSLIKVLMMMQERKITPQPGIPFKLNHNSPRLDALHVQIAGLSGKNMTLKPSPAAIDGKIKCVVSSFDASGGNTSFWWWKMHQNCL
jgi:hypothetical protein